MALKKKSSNQGEHSKCKDPAAFSLASSHPVQSDVMRSVIWEHREWSPHSSPNSFRRPCHTVQNYLLS